MLPEPGVYSASGKTALGSKSFVPTPEHVFITGRLILLNLS